MIHLSLSIYIYYMCIYIQHHPVLSNIDEMVYPTLSDQIWGSNVNHPHRWICIRITRTPAAPQGRASTCLTADVAQGLTVSKLGGFHIINMDSYGYFHPTKICMVYILDDDILKNPTQISIMI